MDVGLTARVMIAVGAAVLAFALVAFGASPAPLHRTHGYRAYRGAHPYRGYGPMRRLLRRAHSANLIAYLAAAMAVSLGWAIALTN